MPSESPLAYNMYLFNLRIANHILIKISDALRRQSRLLNIQSKMKVFNAFTRVSLNYCPLVWVNRNRTAKVPSVMIKWQRILATEVFKAL